MLYTVSLQDLEFYGHHGVAPEERTVGHRFRATVTVTIDSQVPTSDSIEDTVDYGDLAEIIVGIGTGESRKTLECIAGTMGEDILNRFPKVAYVDLSLEKLLPPLPYVVKSARVDVKMTRNSNDQ